MARLGHSLCQDPKDLDENARLAVVSTDELDPGTDQRWRVWASGIHTVIAELSENRDFRPSDVPEALARAGVFEQIGERGTSGITVSETVDDVVMRLHSMNGLGPRALGPRLVEFDRRVRELLEPVAAGKYIQTEFRAVVRWGMPVGRR
ncbi:MAG: hypothetical protein L0227_09050 [Chloroflexi bacterium]|nr:hypothetical protein [Chloroflexota bacterium]